MDGRISSWCGRTVLITGASGFLGAAVARELLDRGARVAGFLDDRSSGAVYAREIAAGSFHALYGPPDSVFRIHTALAVHEADLVFHLDDESGAADETPTERVRRTQRTAAAVLRAAALRRSVPVVTARPRRDLRLLGGADEPTPHGVARFGELFGGGDRRTYRIVPRTIAALLAGTAAGGDGSPRDFVHVRDAARACLAVAEEADAGSSIDLAFRTGWVLTGTEMARTVTAVAAGQAVHAVIDRAPENPFGWKPEQTLEEALRDTFDAYRRERSSALERRSRTAA